MDKAHDVRSVRVAGSSLHMEVDGRPYAIDFAAVSLRLANATDMQRARLEVSPTGYGLHWPILDEDISINGLIGIKHATPSLGRNS